MSRVNLGDVDTDKTPVNAVKQARKAKAAKAVKEALEEMPEVEEVLPMRDYEDTEDEFGSDDMGKSVASDSDLRHVMRDMDSPEGIEGKTDLNQDQATMMLSAKLYAEEYPGLGFENFAKWFGLIQLSVGRASRKERVEILRGNVQLAPSPQDPNRPPSRF